MFQLRAYRNRLLHCAKEKCAGAVGGEGGGQIAIGVICESLRLTCVKGDGVEEPQGRQSPSANKGEMIAGSSGSAAANGSRIRLELGYTEITGRGHVSDVRDNLMTARRITEAEARAGDVAYQKLACTGY